MPVSIERVAIFNLNKWKGIFLTSIFLLCGVHAFSQSQITGVIVSEEDGEGLPGVSIVIEGTTKGTISDIDGSYKINASSDDVLVFSFVGFKDQKILVGAQTTINPKLQLDIAELEEVVVIGYGTIRKSDLTGSVSTIRGDDLIKVSSASPLQALQGKVAGVNVASPNGEPGGNPVVRVRGVGTPNNADPIFVVDGVILDDVSFLNSNDIESMEVLKDASATAIYGSRGANGVFVITTKGSSIGKARKAQISFKTEQSVQRLQNRIDLLNKDEFIDAYESIFPGTFNNTEGLPDIDWQDEIFEESAPIQSYDLSVTGGADNFSFYLGGGMFNQKGIIPKSEFTRYTLKSNTTFKPTSYLTLGSSLSGAFFDDDAAPGVVAAAYGAWPIDSPYDANGEFAEVRGTSNPVATIAFQNNNTKRYRLVTNNYLELNFLDGFRLKTSYQTNFLYSKGTNYSPEFDVSPVQVNAEEDLTISYGESRSWIWENTLSYDKLIAKSHRIGAVVGLTYQEKNDDFPAFNYDNLVDSDPNFWYLNAKDGATDSVNVHYDNVPNRSSLQSYIGRVNYAYNSKYLVTATFRADGSSKFRKEDRWGFFPSFAIGWNVHNEPFFPTGSFIESLKLRASWGIVGNEKVASGDRFSTIDAGDGVVLGRDEVLVAGSSYGDPGNPLLLWENTISTDFGIEFSLLQNKITAEVDYYYKETQDILVSLQPPAHLGYGAFQTVVFNAANVLNKGFEFNLIAREKVGDFDLSLNLNGTTVNNEALSLGSSIPSENRILSGSILGSQVSITEPGESIGSFYGYDVIGVYQNESELDQFPSLNGTGVGDLMYRDVNDDGVINQLDRVIIGSPIPDFTYGFSLNADYKAFSLSLDFQGSHGNDIYNAKNQIRVSLQNFESRVNDRFTTANPSDSEPRLTRAAGSYPPSSYYVEDGSFFRLRTATLSYSLPDQIASKLEIQKLLIYLRGNNIFTLTDYSGYSPEIGSGTPIAAGLDRGIYPITAIYTIGTNIIF